MREPGFETLCAHWGEDPARYHGAVVPPIFQSSLFTSPDSETFSHRGEARASVYDYTRTANPTTDVLEKKIAALEKTEAARCFGSGMAAVSAAILNSVRAGDHVLAVETIYGPSRILLTDYLPKFGIEVSFIAGTNPQQFADSARANTRLFYLESPSSLVFKLQDFRAIASLARERGITTLADNSWASPYFQNPAEYGIDLIVHSATKYLGGHSDVVAGILAGSADRIASIAKWEGALIGGILDPFASWLILRGIRTLGIRMERHQQSAMKVARWLEQHPRVAVVHYPGLESHPQYSLGAKQLRGYGGLFSFELKEGGQAASYAVVDALKYFQIGVSWGGHESLAIPIAFPPERPQAASAEHVYLPGIGSDPSEEVRWGARLHIGLETVEDLLEDLENGLK
jgi:cystathionine beta-lyase